MVIKNSCIRPLIWIHTKSKFFPDPQHIIPPSFMVICPLVLTLSCLQTNTQSNYQTTKSQKNDHLHRGPTASSLKHIQIHWIQILLWVALSRTQS